MPYSICDTVTALRAAILSRYVREPVLVAVAYLLYYLVRHQAAQRTADAFQNAASLVQFEQSLGIFKELSMQAATLPSQGLTQLFNVIYFYGNFPLIILVGAWLFWKHPPLYSLIRNAFLASGAIALVVFLVFPVAPPRLIDAGFVDTLRYTIAITYDNSPGVNQFAAVPSMHVGWSLLLALGLFTAARGPLLRSVALLLPPAMIVATVVTGNHYLLDAAAGIMTAVTGLTIALLIQRYGPLLRDRLPTWLRDEAQRAEAATP